MQKFSRLFVLSLVTVTLSVGHVLADDAAISGEDRPLRKLDWIDLLQRGEYDVLTRRLERLQKRHEKGEISWRPVRTAFKAFHYTDPTLSKKFDAWVAKHPRSFAAYTARGAFLAHLGYTVRGTRAARRTSDKAFVAMSKFQRAALKDLRFASKLNQHAVIPYVELIGLYRVSGPYAGADNTYLIAKDLVPDASLLHEKILYAMHPKWRGGRTRNEYKMHVKAFTDFAKEVVQKSKTDATYHEAAKFLQSLALDQKANRRDYRAALKGYSELLSQGDSAYFRYRRGYILYYMDREEEALADARRAIEIAPDYDRAYRLAGEILKHLKRYPEAGKYYNEAIKLNPLNPETLIEQAGVLRREGRWIEIEKILEQALGLGQWNAEVHAELGQLYDAMNLLKEAKTAYRRSIELVPGDPEVLIDFSQSLIRDRDCTVFDILPNLVEICVAGGNCSNFHLDLVRGNIKSTRMESKCRRKAPWNAKRPVRNGVL